MDLEELYKDTILYYGRNSENKRELEQCDMKKHSINANCGDEITVQIKFNDGLIEDIAFLGNGCMISMASTAIMTDMVKGKDVHEAKEIINTFISMIKKDIDDDSKLDILEDAIVFKNIQNMPARVKCATLAWHTLGEILDSYK